MPFKAVLDLPDIGELSKKTVDTFLKKSKKGVLPSLPKGNFVRLQGPCYMFRHKLTVGCRTTKSRAHLSLPRILKGAALSSLPLPPKERQGIGSMFFDSTLRDYTIQFQKEDDKVLKLGVENVQELNVVMKRTHRKYDANETERTITMYSAIKDCISVEKKLTISNLRDVTNCFCPFSGGGDICICRNDMDGNSLLSGYISTTTSDGDDDDHNQSSPKKEGDLRCTAIENKVSIHQNEESVCNQLKANMLLCSVNQLVMHDQKERFDISKLERIKCYGLAVCFPPLPIVLLELTVDFSKSTYEYKELVRCNNILDCPFVVDCALEYIMKRVSV